MQKFYAINNFNLFIFIRIQQLNYSLQSKKVYSMQITIIITTTTHNQTRTVSEVDIILDWVW